MTKVYAVAQSVPKSKSIYLTSGKEYPVIEDDGANFYLEDDRGDRRRCSWNKCAHLKGGDWTRIEGEEPAAEAPASRAWVEWTGGDQPLPDLTDVEFQQRDGVIQQGRSDVLDWLHNGADVEDGDSDIMRYRVINSAPADVTIAALRELTKAAETYINHYLLDELHDPELCIEPLQHTRIVALSDRVQAARAALAGARE